MILTVRSIAPSKCTQWCLMAFLSCTSLGAGAAGPASDLTKLSLEQLMGLTVTGASKYAQKQSDVAAAVSVVTRDEIRAFGWRTLDEVLASLPGIHLTYDRQYRNFGARGFGLPGDYNTRVLVTVDGNRVNDSVYDQGSIGRTFPVDLDLVERVEFIAGPGGAVYGQNAMFGVVNVVTRTGASVDGVEVAAIAHARQGGGEGRLTWGRKLDNGVDLLVSASEFRVRGQDRYFDFGAAGQAGVARGLDGERDRELFVRMGRGPWSVELIQGARRKYDPAASFQSDPLVAGQYQADRLRLAQWSYQDNFLGGGLQVSARLFAGQEYYTSILSYGTPFSYPAVGDWKGFELRLLSTQVRNHKLMVGIEAQDNPEIRQSILDLVNPANDILIRGNGYRVGVYAQDEWQMRDDLLATLGVRVDRNGATGSATSPRAALIWKASDHTTLKLLAGRAHREANAYEREYDDGVALVGNPNLGRERIDTYEAVVDHRVSQDLAVRASVYRWNMRGLVTLGTDPVSGIAQYQNGDTVKANGLELSADKTWQDGGRLRGSVSFQQVRDISGAILVNSPRVLAKLNYSARLPVAGLRLGYEMQYNGGRKTLLGSTLGGYAVSNLYLSTEKLANGLEVSLGIRNLFDKKYAHPGAETNWQNSLEQDGRSLRLEARYRF